MSSDCCETCGGDGVLIGDAVDGRGEHVDDVQPCPDCAPEDDYDDRTDDERELDRDLHVLNFGDR